MHSRSHEHVATSTHATATSAARWWVGAALLPPLAFRAAALWVVGLPPGWIDARGLASDGVAGLWVAIAAMAAARWRGAAGAAVVGAWLLVCFGNSEHVVANGANARVAHAGFLADDTFLLGSALHASAPLVLALASIATGGLVWRALRSRAPAVPFGRLATGALLMALGLAAWPTALASPEWRQASLLESNLRVGLDAPDRAPGPAAGNVLASDLRREPLDLSGALRLPRATGRPNVLLILLEGISGAHIPLVARANDVASDLSLPHLDRLAAAHVVYTSFVAQQRQTNRGEYAILCGDWPKLRTGVPRMSEHVAHGGLRCLPERMAALGYETVYLQAAPLAFMLKDQFMGRIGFGTVLGNAWFPDAWSRTNWGVDDRTFFEGALREVERLASGERPWFLTLLTVGTHHPYNVPEDFEADGATGFARAALQADQALGDFVDALTARGLLDDTLVLVTSDESAGLDEAAPVDPLTLLLSRSFGFLVVLGPQTRPMQVDEPFVQSDLALSILDHLGAGPDALAGLGGRSVFRHYDAPRRLAFGNTYQRRVFVVEPSGEIDVCREDLSVCSRFRAAPGRPFASGASPVGDLAPHERRALLDWLEVSPAAHGPPDGTWSIGLLSEPEVEVLAGPARYQLVYGGQGLSVPGGSVVELVLDVELRGAAGEVAVRTNLLAPDTRDLPPAYVQRLATGERLRVHWLVETGRPIEDLESRFVVTDRSGPGLTLVFHRATLGVTPSPGVTAGSPPRIARRDQGVTRAP